MSEKANPYIAMLDKLRRSQSETAAFGFGLAEWHNTFSHFLGMRDQDWSEHVTYYCSDVVAKSIIGDGVLWMCDVRNMNDKSEFLFASAQFDEELNRLRLLGSFPDGLLNALAESKKQFVASADNAVFDDKLVLAMCTSALPDDAAMWERYGKSGTGVGIRFNLQKLEAVISTASIFVPNSNRFDTGIVEVCYPDPVCSCLQQMVTQSLAAFCQAETPDENNFVRTLLHADVLEYLVRHKHPTFASEREIRIYSRAPARKTWTGSNHVYEHIAGCRTSRHAEVFLPHLAINQSEEEFWRELVSDVTFGPCSSASTCANLKEALATRGLDSRAKGSTCPLRP